MTDSVNIINIKKLKKTFSNTVAVDDVSYQVQQGEMFGLVGPDGAGKTTTIRILCGLISSDSGTVTLFDEDIKSNRKKIQNSIGYLSQKFSLYGDLSVDENIEFFAEIHNVADYRSRRDELLAFTRLLPFRDRLADKLSGGMKQKLALACNLIHKPKILFLDEPTTGVDPVSRRDFWKILSQLLKDGITIFMTTPYLDEAERCNRVALMHEGKIISIDTPAKIKQQMEFQTIEIITNDIKKTYALLKNNEQVESQIFGDRIDLILKDGTNDLNKIEKLLDENSIQLISKRTIPPSLENVFIHLVKKAN